MTIFRWRKTIEVIARKQPEAGSFLGKQVIRVICENPKHKQRQG